MFRIFCISSALTIILILISGGGTYWISQSEIQQAKLESTKAIAKGLALGIASRLDILQNTVSNMAATTEVITSVNSNNARQRTQTESRMEALLPTVLKIRILPANIDNLDESSIPHMGNADLLMVQETLKKKQLPILQGVGKNRHLAITAVIKKDGVPIGVILASLKFDFLQSTFNKPRIPEGFIELEQGNSSLAKAGNSASKTDSINTVKISRSAWSINYWSTHTTSMGSLGAIASTVIIPVLLACLIFFVSYRNLSNGLRQDQGAILKAVKDLMSGKNTGSYPINLNEMKAIIPTIIQFKRVLDNEDSDASSEVTADIETDNFFDEPDHHGFLNTEPDIENKKTKNQATGNSSTSLSKTKKQQKSDRGFFTSDSRPLVKKDTKSTLFKAYDIRGIAGKTLTQELVFDIGRAVASEAKEQSIKTIIIGRDGRTSSPALAESLAKGIASTGVNVLDIGLVPSPVVYFVTQHTEGKSGVVITGSHNPAEYNGLKITINGESLAGDKIQQLKQRIDDENYLTGETGSIEQNNLFKNEYIGTISEDIHIVRPMKVVVDCGNGAAGELAPILLKTLGCEVIELFCEIDGTFPNHHPDPSNPDNLIDLITAVQHFEADVGIAFDGDGDRLGVVDNKGKIIWPDRQMMLFAKDVLASKPGAEIIYDVKCSRHLGEQITKSGGRPLMWKTGHSFMKAKLKETAAALAGEMSGHIFFNDRWFGFDDALYSASRLIEILSSDTRNSAEVFSDYPDSINTPEINIQLSDGENVDFMEQLFATADFNDGKIINIDGLRVEFTDGWGLVRASNTMPVLVLRFEADNKTALQRIQSQFKDLLTKVNPDLKIPF